MTEHPLHSDKDNYIRNLESKIGELERANEILSGHRQRERKRKLAKAFKVLLLFAIVSPVVTGGGYLAYSCDADLQRLHKRCSKLCGLAIGDISLHGYFSTNKTRRDYGRYCKCRTRLGTEVTLPRTSRIEFEGDLSEIVKKLDIKTWKHCMEVKEFFSKLECSHIPWIVNFNDKAEQDRVDGGND
jgi:hypothetical protein